jgi:circadian clock protein KaiC
MMMTDTPDQDMPSLVETGIGGLDNVLLGGLVPNGLYLIEGPSGSGKTTLALQFLLAGARRGERCLFVTLSESEHELRASAESHGWTLEGVNVLEIIVSEESLKADARYTMYHPSEVELAQTTKAVLAEADRIKPARLVVDSLSEFRLLAENPFRYRRQILALKQYFARQQSTVLLIDDWTSREKDVHLQSLAHGVIGLDSHTAEYGPIRRRVHVDKLRGRAFREGYHDFVIRRGGIEIFPRLVAAEHQVSGTRQLIKSGVQSLDDLLGGGLTQGTSTLIVGAARTGKSSLASQYVHVMATRGEHASVFLFDEAISTFLQRSADLAMDLEPLVEAGHLSVRQVDAAEWSPGLFAHTVRVAVEKDKSRLIVLDSLNGYLHAMPSERFLELHLHELLSYLAHQNVTTLLVMTQHGIVGGSMPAPVEASYLADTVMLLRYFEAFGEVRQAISVIKKRTGRHERTIRELSFDRRLAIGEPVRDFQGVLAGSPQFVGKALGGTKRNDERDSDT